MAVVDRRDGGDAMEAGIEGELSVSDECVLIEPFGGEETLLLFRSSEVAWDADTREIIFSQDGSTVRLGDGQNVVLGGGGSSVDEDGSTEDFVRDTDWVNEPSPSCLRPYRFEVNSVVQPGP